MSIGMHREHVVSARKSTWSDDLFPFCKRYLTKAGDLGWSRVIPSLCRRVRRQIRIRVRPILSQPPRILHLSLVGKEGKNRGDACMCLAVPRIIKRVCPNASFTHCRMCEIRENVPILGEVGPCDMVVIGGGGLYGRWYDLSRYARLKELGVPVILYGLGVNLRNGMEELPERSLAGARILNDIASLSSVRDSASQSYLSRYGIETQVIGDPAAFYDPVDSVHGRDGRSLNVGLNLPYHEASLRAEVETLAIPAVRRVALHLLKKGARLHYLLHHPSEVSVLRHLRDIPMTIHRHGIPRLIEQYHKMDMVICGMLHSAIFSFNAEVPFIVIAYDQKHRGFMELIGAEAHLRLIGDVNYEWLKDTTDRVMAERAIVRNELVSARKRLWQKHRAFLETALGLLPMAGRNASSEHGIDALAC